MPDEQNIITAENENIQAGKQNPVSEESSIPPSPQESTEQVPENTAYSEPSVAPPDATEASVDDFPLKSNDIIPPSDSTTVEPEKEPENQASSDAEALADRENEPVTEPVSEPIQATEPPNLDSSPQATAQMAGNEPLSESVKPETVPVIVSNKNKIIELLDMAKNAIQFRKRKKLDKVMAMFLKKSKITNDEVEKFLHVSDATATRYLSILKKEEKIKQTGKTGHSVFYSKI